MLYHSFRDIGRCPLAIASKQFKYFRFYYYLLTIKLVSKAPTMNHTTQNITQLLRVENVFVKVTTKLGSLLKNFAFFLSETSRPTPLVIYGL